MRSRKNTDRVERISTHRVTAKAMGAVRALELDGDVIGQAREIAMWLDEKALLVRVAYPKHSRRSDVRSRIPGRLGRGFKIADTA